MISCYLSSRFSISLCKCLSIKKHHFYARNRIRLGRTLQNRNLLQNSWSDKVEIRLREKGWRSAQNRLNWLQGYEQRSWNLSLIKLTIFLSFWVDLSMSELFKVGKSRIKLLIDFTSIYLVSRNWIFLGVTLQNSWFDKVEKRLIERELQGYKQMNWISNFIVQHNKNGLYRHIDSKWNPHDPSFCCWFSDVHGSMNLCMMFKRGLWVLLAP